MKKVKITPEETYRKYIYQYYFDKIYFIRFNLSCLTLAELWMEECLDDLTLIVLPVWCITFKEVVKA